MGKSSVGSFYETDIGFACKTMTEKSLKLRKLTFDIE